MDINEVDPLADVIATEPSSEQVFATDPLADFGGQLITQDKVLERKEAEEYQSGAKAALAFGAGAARGVTFGLSDVLLRGVGLNEEARKLQKYLPAASIAGEITGGIGGAFLGPGALVARGATAATKGITSGLGRAAAREALEAGIYGVGQTISDQALGTPDSVAESLVANVGLGAILGAPLGAAMHGVSTVTKFATGQVRKVLKGDDAVSKWVGANQTYVEELGEVVTQERFAELKRISDEMGIPLTEAMKTDSYLIRGLESTLAQKPTATGERVRKEIAPTFKAIQKQAAKLVDDAATESVESVGERVKDEFIARAHQLYDPANYIYSRLQSSLDTIALPENAKQSFIKSLTAYSQKNTLSNSPTRKAINDTIENLLEQESLPIAKLKAISSDISGRVQNLKQTGFANEARLLGQVKRKVDSFMERQIKRASIGSAATKAEGKAIADELTGEIATAKGKWSEFKRFLEDVGEEAGLGKVKSFDQFIDRLENISNEKLARNLFDTKDPRTIIFMKKTFPDIFEDFRKIEVAKLKAKSAGFDQTGAPITDILKLSKEIRKYKPEVINLVLGKERVKNIYNLEKISRSMPRKIGPSGTPEGMWFSDILKPVMALKDAAVYGVYKGGKIALDTADHQAQETRKWIAKFLAGAKKPIVPTATITATSMMHDYAHDLNYVESLAMNPDKFMQAIDDNTRGIGEVDGELQAALANTAMAGTQYLQSKAPKNPFSMNLFKGKVKWRPSDKELSTFNRYIRAVNDPYSILVDLNDGVLTNESVDAVRSVYPAIYKKITDEVLSQLDDSVALPYTKQLQLSILLGQPLTNPQESQMMQRLQKGARIQGLQEEMMQGPKPKPSRKLSSDMTKNIMGQSEQLIRSRGE